MSTESKRMVVSAEVVSVDCLQKLLAMAEQHEDPLNVDIYSADGRALVKARLVENTLTDGSKTYDVVLQFE